MFLNLLESKVSQYFSAHNKIHYLGLWAAIVFVWVLFFPYAGVIHDAQIYALQALSHVAPELYKNDIFLRFGSQDQFTLFSPLYGWAIKVVGYERAGAWIMLASHVLFFSGIFFVAKKIMPYGLAVFSVGLILVVSSYYSSWGLLHYIELFVTSRMLAEAFVLFSIAAWLSKKNIAAALFLLIALALHPLMAAAGIVFFSAGIYAAYWRSLSVFFVVACSALCLIAFTTQFLTHWQFDTEWLNIVEKRNVMLFFHLWSVDDFSNVLVPLVSLIIACLFLQKETEKKIAVSALFTWIMGFLVQAVGSDLLHIKLITQGQAWRWFWLATLLAILLLPNLILQLWQKKKAGKILAVTLIAAWLMRSQLMGFVVVIWSLILACALRQQWGSTFFWSVAKWAAVVFGLLPVVLLIGINHFHIAVVIALFAGARLQDFHSIWHESAVFLYFLLVGGLIYSSFYKWGQLFVATALFLMAFLAFWCWGKSWLPETGTKSVFERFAEVRNIIPVGEDVFVLGVPEITWVALQRPNYLSGIQMAGIVFSRQTAIEADRRRKAILQLCPLADIDVCDRDWASWLPTVADFSPFCKTAGVRFVMSSSAIEAKGLVAIPLPEAQKLPYLYRCAVE